MVVDPTQGAQGALPDIDLDSSTLVEEEKFLGLIVADEFTPAKAEYGGGFQWHIGVKPVGIKIGGTTGAFHTWARVSTVKKSQMGLMMLAFEAVFGKTHPDGTKRKIGRGEFVQEVAWLVRRDIKFGRKNGEDIVARGTLIPVGKATDEERALVRAGGEGAVETPKIAAPEWTDETRDAILTLVVGKRQAEYQKAAATAKGLSAEVKNAILSGAALKYLVAHDLVSVSSDGVVIPMAAGVVEPTAPAD